MKNLMSLCLCLDTIILKHARGDLKIDNGYLVISGIFSALTACKAVVLNLFITKPPVGFYHISQYLTREEFLLFLKGSRSL